VVKRVFELLHRDVRGLHEAAYLLAALTICSQLLSLARNKLLAHFVPVERLDLYFGAFRVPDLLFVGIASFVSISVIIPILAARVERDLADARRFISGVFFAFSALMLVAAAIAFIAAPSLGALFFPGFSAADIEHELVPLMRIMLLSPFLLGISNLFASVTQVYQRFFLYAASPFLYNLGTIVGILFLYPRFGARGLAFGVVLGAALHLVVQLPFIIERRFLPQFVFPNLREVGSVFLLSLPRTAGLAVQQVSLAILFAFASFGIPGSIAVFQFASDLQSVPLTIIGASYSLAAFPTLARLISRGENQRFFTHIETATRHVIFWALPAATLVVVLRAQLVRVIFGSGAFGWTETRLTTAVLAAFAISILAQSLVLLFARGYYAAGNTKKPLVVNLSSAGATIISAAIFFALFERVPTFSTFLTSLFRITDVPGNSIIVLPLAYSFGQLVNAIALWIFFSRDFKQFSQRVFQMFLENLIGALVLGIVAVGLLNIFDDVFDLTATFGVLAQGFFAGIGGMAAAVTTLYGLGSRELTEIWRAVRRKLSLRNPPVADELRI
jgi:putative peptidoglycan lipid II flippase